MPRVIALTEIAAILESGDFNQLIGGIEDEHIECKSAPYQLEREREKMELAKDVSALANADGGIILLGIHTEQEPTYPGDIIRRVGCFPESRVNLRQYHSVISDWITPAIPGLRFAWHASAPDSGEGIVSILVPQEASRERPFLVSKVVESGGKVIGSYVGFFERTRDNVMPIKPEQLREALKDGRRFSELDARLGNIEEMVGKVIAQPLREQPALSGDAVLRRVQRARQVLGYESKPTFSLAAWLTCPPFLVQS